MCVNTAIFVAGRQLPQKIGTGNVPHLADDMRGRKSAPKIDADFGSRNGNRLSERVTEQKTPMFCYD